MTSIEVEKTVVMNEILLNLEEENVKVPTSYGDILVQIYGERTKHPLVTFHDVGLNAEDNFRIFFQLFTPTEFAQEFCFYNINAPFQEKSAEHISRSAHYPTMENLSAIVDEIVRHFDFKSFVGMGIGAGSYVLLEYAVKHQNKLNGLILLNSIANAPSWYEWGREKLNVRDLRQHGITDSVVDFLMWHNFGTHLEKCNPDLVQGYRKYFEQLNNPNNLAAFIESYLHRKAIEFPRGPCGHISKCGHEPSCLFLVPILQIVGERIYSLTDVEAIRAKLISSKNELVKLADCSGRVLDEAPDKVLEAMMLFLQVPSINVHEILSRENEDVNEKITRTEISVKETMNESF